MKIKWNRIIIITIMTFCMAMFSFNLAACGEEVTENPSGTTDELFSDSQSGAVLEVYKQDGRVYTVDYNYEIPELMSYEELEDGKYYKVTADVTFLNGGVAGYVDYPQIDHVIDIEEIPSKESPEETSN